MWAAVSKEGEDGTLENPITAARRMEYVYGKYYRDPEDGKLYLCKRTGEEEGGKVTLQFLPHELVAQYFEEVQGLIPSEGGSNEHSRNFGWRGGVLLVLMTIVDRPPSKSIRGRPSLRRLAGQSTGR